MSDDQRGAYTPPSDRLAFDPREPVRSGPPPVTLILSGLVLLGLLGGVAFLYRHGIRHPGAAPAEVGQPVGEMKTLSPEAANAMSTSLQQGGAAANAAPTFAAEPEQPLPRQSLAPVVAVAPPAAPQSVSGAAPQAVPAAAPPPRPPTVASAEPAQPAKPLTIASLTDAAISKPPPKPKAGVVAAAKPSLAPAAVAAPAAGWVQIGAFSSPALAAKGWSDIAKLAPAAMAGKGKTVQPVTTGGTILYRTYITGFASRDAAEAFCGKLKAAGKNCFVK
jgi:hypothetical protein